LQAVDSLPASPQNVTEIIADFLKKASPALTFVSAGLALWSAIQQPGRVLVSVHKGFLKVGDNWG
jgi:hypothetical protein